MINMDMVGRLNQDKVLNVGGIGSSPIFKELIEKINLLVITWH
jgi:hypothetical protein